MFEQNIPQEALTTMTSIPSTGQMTQRPLRDSVRQAVSGYVSKLNGKDTEDLYELALCEVEAPMLDVIMQYTRGNQTRAANMMGINRGTLRKKLKKYGLD